MSGGKSKKRGVFESMTAALEAGGPFDATVLASSDPPRRASPRATRAAQHLVGTVHGEKGRISRLAELLDDLCAADASQTSKRRHAS